MTPGHPPAAARGSAPGRLAASPGGAPICRNVILSGRRTSVRMEPVMWVSLEEICLHEGLTVNELCGEIDLRRGEAGLTAALRVFIICYFREVVRRCRTPRPAHPPPRQQRSAGGSAMVAAVLEVFGPPVG